MRINPSRYSATERYPGDRFGSLAAVRVSPSAFVLPALIRRIRTSRLSDLTTIQLVLTQRLCPLLAIQELLRFTHEEEIADRLSQRAGSAKPCGWPLAIPAPS